MDGKNDYRETGTYKRADAEERRRLEAWKKDQQISDNHMALLLALEDLRQLPKEEKKKGNKAAETLLVLSMFFFLFAVSMQQNGVLLVASVIVIINTVIYLSGITNPYSNVTRQIKKKLKACPKVESFAQWQASHTVDSAGED